MTQQGVQPGVWAGQSFAVLSGFPRTPGGKGLSRPPGWAECEAPKKYKEYSQGGARGGNWVSPSNARRRRRQRILMVARWQHLTTHHTHPRPWHSKACNQALGLGNVLLLFHGFLTHARHQGVAEALAWAELWFALGISQRTASTKGLQRRLLWQSFGLFSESLYARPGPRGCRGAAFTHWIPCACRGAPVFGGPSRPNLSSTPW